MMMNSFQSIVTQLTHLSSKYKLSAFLDECTEEAKSLGLTGPNFVAKSVIPRLIRSGRTALCLQSFYTAGPKEVRAWTIQKGTLAPQGTFLCSCYYFYSLPF